MIWLRKKTHIDAIVISLEGIVVPEFLRYDQKQVLDELRENLGKFYEDAPERSFGFECPVIKWMDYH
jgi:hypothetical protein